MCPSSPGRIRRGHLVPAARWPGFRLVRPARYDDPLRIRTRVTSAKRRVITFGYEILHDETGELLATGETTHVVCDSNGRPKPLPEKYRRYFNFENAESPSAKTED